MTTVTSRHFAGYLLFLSAIFVAGPLQAQSVDLLTGRARVSIPLWELNYGGISVPISIWHHGSSLRVEEGDGSCGMGWNLSVGGSMSRQVRGLPDDYNVANDDRKGWLFSSNAANVQSFTVGSNDALDVCTDEGGDFTTIDGFGRTKDSEPDIFYFNAPGLSGQFVFGSDGNPKLLSYQDLKFNIYKDASDRITYFEVITSLGMKYTFSIRENVTRKVYKKTPIYVSYFRREYLYYQQPATYTSAWYLSKIESAASGQNITFSYTDAGETEGNRFVITMASDNVADTLYYVRESLTPRQLTTITAGGYTATITWLNDLVRKVSVAEAAYSNTREFDFIYRGFRSSTNTSEPKIYHYFLKEIKQLHNCQPFPDYSFAYQSVTFGTGDIGTVVFPWETRHKQDYWGYYNGNSTNKNIPKTYYYSGESDGKRLRIYPLTGSATSTFTGDNREVDTAKVGFGALTEINYPRGGQTKFTYEPQKFYDSQVSRSYYGGGVRVKRVTSSGGEVAYGGGSTSHPATHAIQTDYDYKLSNDTTSGLISYPPKFAFATDSGIFRTPYLLGENPEILYSRVTEKIAGKGSTVYEFDLPAMYPYSSGTFSKIARSGGTCAIGFFKNGVYTFPFAPHTNVDRGLLKKQTEYSQTGALVRQRRMTYTTLSPAATTVYGLHFEQSTNSVKVAIGYHFSKYSISTGTVKVLSEEVTKEIGEENAADSTKSTVAYGYNGNYMLETITRTNDDGSVTKEKIRYAKDYSITYPGSDVTATAVKQLNTDNRHGEVVERIQKLTTPGGSEKVTGASLILYKVFSNGRLLPYQLLNYPPVTSYYYQSAVTGTNPQIIKYDSSYVLARTIDEYDVEGNVIIESDNKKNVVGYHRGISYSMPAVATFALCKGSEAVYEGFEWTTGRGFSLYGGTTGWTGEKGYQLAASGSIGSASVTRNGTKYRVSCWASAGQATTLTFKAKNGSSDVSGSTTTLTYNPSVMNTWTYLEGVMDVTNAPSTFTVALSTNQAVTLDDIIAIPVKASIALNTYKPLVGVTSLTDDRGNSVTFTFDSIGRKVNTFDRKRNLVETKQYLVAVARARKLTAGFTSSNLVHRKSQTTTFTAVNIGCIEGVSYAWEIYGSGSTPVATSSSSTIAYSFAAMGPHNVKLTVSQSSYGSVTYVENICVGEPTPVALTFYMSGGTSTVYRCNDLDRTFYLFHPPSSDGTKTVTYTWYIKRASMGFWEPIAEAPNAGSMDFTSPLENYSIKCKVSIRYNLVPVSEGLCPTACQPPAQETTEMNISYVDDGPCT